MKNSFYAIAAAAAVATPGVASAQGLTDLKTLVGAIGDIVDLAIPIVASIALIAFFWGLAKYIFSAGDPEAQKSGRGIMIWGVVALFVLVSIWGIISFIGEAIGIEGDDNNPVDIPVFNSTDTTG